MATIINYDKPTRAAKEQDAFQKLQSTLGRTPTQQEVYEQAYGSRFPVFNTDFEYNRIKEQIPETYKQYLEAPDKFMQDLVRPQRETAYAKKVNKALEGVGFMQKMALNNSILGDRSRAINDTVANRTNALGQFMNLQNMKLEQAKEPYAYAIDQANAGDAAYAAQLAHQQELQDYLWKKQVDQGFKTSRGPGDGSMDLSDTQKLEMVGLGLNPSNPTDIAQYAALKAQNTYGVTPGSSEDIFNARQGVASDLANGATFDEVISALQNQGYDPADFADVISQAPGYQDYKNTQEGAYQTPGFLKGILGNWLFRKG